MQIEHVVAKSVYVAGSVRRQAFQDVLVDGIALILHFLELARHPLDVVQNDHVGDQLVVLDDLALLVADIFGNNALPAEEQPLREIVEFLALVGCRVNGAPELDVVDVLQKELCPDHPAEFTKEWKHGNQCRAH